MLKIFLKALTLGVLLFSYQIVANAQNKSEVRKSDSNIIATGAKKTLIVGGKVAFIVVKETAKATWATTKFSTTEIAAPITKAIVVKTAPKVSLFILKKGTPVALKLLVTYLKL